MAVRRSNQPDVAAVRAAFGRRIRELREQQGLRQADLAERCGVHVAYLSALENGHRNPTLDVIARIAGGLGVPVAELFVV